MIVPNRRSRLATISRNTALGTVIVGVLLCSMPPAMAQRPKRSSSDKEAKVAAARARAQANARRPRALPPRPARPPPPPPGPNPPPPPPQGPPGAPDCQKPPLHTSSEPLVARGHPSYTFGGPFGGQADAPRFSVDSFDTQDRATHCSGDPSSARIHASRVPREPFDA